MKTISLTDDEISLIDDSLIVWEQSNEEEIRNKRLSEYSNTLKELRKKLELDPANSRMSTPVPVDLSKAKVGDQVTIITKDRERISGIVEKVSKAGITVDNDASINSEKLESRTVKWTVIVDIELN